MALSDLMKKGFLASAIVTPATVATHYGETPPTVATVATVAVTNTSNLKEKFDASSFQKWQVDLVHEFVEIDCMTLLEAQQLAAVSVMPRPVEEWLSLIDELDNLVRQHGQMANLNVDSVLTSLETRRHQSLKSIPESIAWYQSEINRMKG